jgi:hypothetical protein
MMPKNEAGANRHQLRLWLKWVIESGRLEKLPPQYDADDSGDPQPTDRYAKQLLAELRDPDSSRRPLVQIVADARRFRAWFDFREKATRRIILSGGQTYGALEAVRTRPPPLRPGFKPRLNPMWDDWIDG